MVSSTSALTGYSGVLAADQIQALDAAAAPLTPEQLTWASGYLAGLAVAGRQPAAVDAPDSGQIQPDNAPELAIVFGSQTGHSESIAESLYQSAAHAGISAKLINMADTSARKLAKERWIALVVSTHGEGDPPDDAVVLLEQLGKPRAPKFDGVKFSVLALGDSSYAQFCQTGKDFQAALLALGAETVTPIVECDVDYDAEAARWREQALNDYREHNGSDAARPALHVVPTATTNLREGIATVITNQRITGSQSSKVVHHIELAFDTPLDYQPGDSLGVHLPNPDVVVRSLLDATELPAHAAVQIDGETLSLTDALKHKREITRISGAFLDAYATLEGVLGLADQLSEADSKRQLLERGHISDIVLKYPHTASAQSFVECLRPLQHRLYSIASSPDETPDEVHLTVAEVRFEVDGNQRFGAVSRSLIDQLEEGDEVSVFVEPNTRFRLPEEGNTDVIMIGPGTGVAPFRSFVQHRAAQDAAGRHWLFFGDRNFSEDFLYQTEWQSHLRSGALNKLDVAFSRDQSHKVYVQDRLSEQSDTLLEWIDNGAAIYVCGDSSAMAPDVHAALIEILASRHGGDIDAGTSALETLRRERRYLRDVY